MNNLLPTELPRLPLLLWSTPPGLALALRQEGVPFVRVPEAHPLAFRAGRFVLYDGRRVPKSKVQGMLAREHVAIDVDAFRRGDHVDPFEALIDAKATQATWLVGEFELAERVARFPKAAIRRRLIAWLREAITGAGGLWARLAPFPFPYRSAFNLRIDLDEHNPDDYARFARARAPIEDCTTHFVSTHAYGRDAGVLGDLRRLDTQSHGHYHVVYRSGEANRRNLERAHARLAGAGITPVGFVAPHGRWNAGLDRAAEDLGYEYASEFQLGYDDWPFFPWRQGQLSRVLQVPVHPVCEGLFLDAGTTSGRPIADYLAGTVRSKIAAGEAAFVYGHPERRLGRFPDIVTALARAIDGHSLLWRVTMTEFARWWRWRSERTWGVVSRGEARFEVQFDDWDTRYPLAMEIERGRHVASIPLTGPRTTIRLDDLAYERRPRIDLAEPIASRRPRSLKSAVRAALDWETVTPIADLPVDSLADRLKKGLRRWKAGARREEEASAWR